MPLCDCAVPSPAIGGVLCTRCHAIVPESYRAGVLERSHVDGTYQRRTGRVIEPHPDPYRLENWASEIRGRSA